MKKSAKGKRRGKSTSPIAERGASGLAICKCGATAPSDRDPQRCSNGHLLKGNTESLVHGLRSDRARNALLPGQEALHALAAERREELLRDLGGVAAVGIVKGDAAKRFVELSIIGDTLVANLTEHGILTKGKQRAALTAYLSVVDRLNKLTQTLGIHRQPKPIASLQDYIAQHGAEETTDAMP